VKMPDYTDDYPNMIEPADILFERTRGEFDWHGNDEMDEACGDGWASPIIRTCGETDRLDPPGMPRSRRRLRRSSSAPDPCRLRRLLQRTPNASVPGEGLTASSKGATARPTRCSAHPGRASPSILPDVVFRQAQPYPKRSVDPAIDFTARPTDRSESA
jgi:hypothetical protein